VIVQIAERPRQSGPRTQGGLKMESESFQENTPNCVNLAKTGLFPS
jgi:hypothetical protein